MASLTELRAALEACEAEHPLPDFCDWRLEGWDTNCQFVVEVSPHLGELRGREGGVVRWEVEYARHTQQWLGLDSLKSVAVPAAALDAWGRMRTRVAAYLDGQHAVTRRVR